MLLSNKVISCSFSFIAPSFMNTHWEENAVALVDIKKKFKRGGFILGLISGEVRILLCKTTYRFIDMQNATEYHRVETVIGGIVAVLPN